MGEKILLQSLSSDLKRITLSIERGSVATAARFNQEAEKWLREAKGKTTDPSIKKLLKRVEQVLQGENNPEKAEDCLMYATLLQNRSI